MGQAPATDVSKAEGARAGGRFHYEGTSVGRYAHAELLGGDDMMPSPRSRVCVEMCTMCAVWMYNLGRYTARSLALYDVDHLVYRSGRRATTISDYV